MKKTPSVVRKYRKPDTLLIEQALVLAGLFEADLEQFGPFAPQFNTEYVTRWRADITAADELMNDTQVVDGIQILSEELFNLLGESRDHFQSMAFYVKRAFAQSKAVQNYFGLDKYDFYRRTVMRMRELLQQAWRAAEKPEYKPLLVAQGFVQANITRLQTLAADLLQKNDDQEDLKRQRLVLTEQRVNAFNKVWEYMVDVSEAAKIIFSNDPAKLQQYLLYPETPDNKPVFEGVGTVSGTITDDTGQPLVNVTVEVEGTDITDVSTADGGYLLEGVPAGKRSITFTCTGFEPKTVEAVTVTAEQTLDLDVSLEPVNPA